MTDLRGGKVELAVNTSSALDPVLWKPLLPHHRDQNTLQDLTRLSVTDRWFPPCDVLFSILSASRASKRARPTRSSLSTSATSSTSPRRDARRGTSCVSRCPVVRPWCWRSRAKSRPSGGSRYCPSPPGGADLQSQTRPGGRKSLQRFLSCVSRWCKTSAASVATPREWTDPRLPSYRGSWNWTRCGFFNFSFNLKILIPKKKKPHQFKLWLASSGPNMTHFFLWLRVPGSE